MAQGPLDVPPRFRGLRGVLGVHPGLGVILAAFLLFPRYASTYWDFYVSAGMVLAIACLGLLVIVGWARDISLAQAGLTGSALYISSYVYHGRVYGETRPFLIGAIVAIACVVAMSVLVALVSYRLSAVYVIVLTASLQFVLESSLTRPGHLGGLPIPPYVRPDFFTLSMQSDEDFYYYVLGALLVTIGFLHRLRISRFGRSLILVGSDPQAADVSGVSPWRYRVYAFAIAGLFAGIAGALSGPLHVSPPGTLECITFNSVFYISILVLAGFDSLTTVACLAAGFTLLAKVVLDGTINVHLLGGAGMLVGVLLGPRGLAGGLAGGLGDLLDPRRRAVRRVRRAGQPPWSPYDLTSSLARARGDRP